jgi:CRISPR/Cas system-associated endonuclease Cas1
LGLLTRSKIPNISFVLHVLHGKTRRGALVFDIADLIEDAYVMPLAFLSAKSGTARGMSVLP